jgi:aminomethyltransferase
VLFLVDLVQEIHLRFEANLPLYGHEISESINPIEAGLGFAVKFDKDFIGKDALVQC